MHTHMNKHYSLKENSSSLKKTNFKERSLAETDLIGEGRLD